MRYFIILAVALTSILSLSCGESRDNETAGQLDEAGAAMNRGDYAEAVRLCDTLTQSADTSAMTWREYCTAAIVYATAYDHDIETQSSMASATKCLSRAMSMAPDSVAMLLSAVSPETAAALNTAVRALDGLNTDRSRFGDHEEDEFNESDSLAVTTSE